MSSSGVIEPVRSFFRDLRFGTKLILVAIISIVGLLCFVLWYERMLQRTARIAGASESVAALPAFSGVIANSLLELQKERGLAVAKSADLKAQIANTDKAITDLRARLQSAPYSSIENSKSTTAQTAEFQAASQEAIKALDTLAETRKNLDAGKAAPAATLAAYGAINKSLLRLNDSLSLLSNDVPTAKSLSSCLDVLMVKEAYAEGAAAVNACLAAGQVDPAIKTMIDRNISAKDGLAETFKFSANKEERDLFDKTVGEAFSELDAAAQSLGTAKTTPAEWWPKATASLGKFVGPEKAGIEGVVFARSLAAANAVVSAIWKDKVLAVVIFVVIALLILLMALTVNSMITQQLNSVTDLLAQIGIGNFAARAEILGNDELGSVAMSLNAMLDNTLRLIQSEQERDAIQASIKKLLDDVSGVASGDLTVEAEVTADFTGAIADSFNFMISQLREIVANVQDATLQVSASANQIQNTTEHLARGSEAQVQQIVDTSAAIDEIAVSIQQVAENTVRSAQIAEEARTNAKKGAESVQNTIKAMDRIRNQVQETAKRIKRLGESSQEIGEITQLIGDIADRTSILALNASIQAAMAGEAGQGFAVVAEEVERLAERANNATKQIATLIKTIQSDTNEAVSAMEESTREVVEGSKLATQAGSSLSEIEGTSNVQAELIQSISLAAKQQARGAEALSKSMNEISEVTQHTAVGAKQAAAAVMNLAKLADELRGSVTMFKLPGSNGMSEGSTIFRRFQGLSGSGGSSISGGEQSSQRR